MRALSSSKGVGAIRAGMTETEGLLPGTEGAGDCSGWAGASVAGAFGLASLTEVLSAMLNKGIGPFRPSRSQAMRACCWTRITLLTYS